MTFVLAAEAGRQVKCLTHFGIFRYRWTMPTCTTLPGTTLLALATADTASATTLFVIDDINAVRSAGNIAWLAGTQAVITGQMRGRTYRCLTRLPNCSSLRQWMGA